MREHLGAEAGRMAPSCRAVLASCAQADAICNNLRARLAVIDTDFGDVTFGHDAAGTDTKSPAWDISCCGNSEGVHGKEGDDDMSEGDVDVDLPKGYEFPVIDAQQGLKLNSADSGMRATEGTAIRVLACAPADEVSDTDAAAALEREILMRGPPSGAALGRPPADSLASPQLTSGKGRGGAAGGGAGGGAARRREGRGSHVKYEPKVRSLMMLNGEATSSVIAAAELERAAPEEHPALRSEAPLDPKANPRCDTEDEDADMINEVNAERNGAFDFPEPQSLVPERHGDMQSADAAAGGPARRKRDDGEQGSKMLKEELVTMCESAGASADAPCATSSSASSPGDAAARCVGNVAEEAMQGDVIGSVDAKVGDKRVDTDIVSAKRVVSSDVTHEAAASPVYAAAAARGGAIEPELITSAGAGCTAGAEGLCGKNFTAPALSDLIARFGGGSSAARLTAVDMDALASQGRRILERCPLWARRRRVTIWKPKLVEWADRLTAVYGRMMEREDLIGPHRELVREIGLTLGSMCAGSEWSSSADEDYGDIRHRCGEG